VLGHGTPERIAITRSVDGMRVGEWLLEWAVDRIAKPGLRFARLDAIASDERLCSYNEQHGFRRVEPTKIPPEVGMKAGLPNNKGRFTLSTVGKTVLASLMEWRNGQRLQKIVFQMATALTRDYVSRPDCIVPAHALFPQMRAIVDRYIREKVEPVPPGEKIDVGISPYYGWAIENLLNAIHLDQSGGEEPELPIYDKRGDGSTANVDFLDQPRRSGSRAQPSQLRRGGHGEMGAIRSLLYRHAQARRFVREKLRAGLYHPLLLQRPGSRLRAGLHHQAQDRAAEPSDS